jgi:hypothetical protein
LARFGFDFINLFPFARSLFQVFSLMTVACRGVFSFYLLLVLAKILASFLAFIGVSILWGRVRSPVSNSNGLVTLFAWRFGVF